MSREPEDLSLPAHGALGEQQDGTEPRSARTSGSGAARHWTRRLVHSLVLLDSWTPASHRLSSPQAARRHLRTEWTRSGGLTERQAAALVALEETTPWQV
jgi:hypothetical protein